MAGTGLLIGSFLKSYTQARQQKEDREDQKKERDAKLKLFELELKRAQAAQASGEQAAGARKQFFDQLDPLQPMVPGKPQETPKTLMDLLSDPQGSALALQGGVISPDELVKAQAQGRNQDLLKQLLGGAGGPGGSGGSGGSGGPGGFEVSGVKLDTSGNPMIDLSRRGEVARWMVSPDGRNQIGVDKMGSPVITMPAGPDARAPEDVPLGPDKLADMRDRNGKMLPPGTTLRQAQAMGANTSPKPAEADKKASMLLQGMQDAEATVAGLAGSDTSSMLNTALSKTPVTEIFTSAPYRKYETAAKRWAQNYLYLKSGAQASEKEVTTTFHTFFPQPGDSDQVKAQKLMMRQQEAANVAKTYAPSGGGSNVVDFNSLPP